MEFDTSPKLKHQNFNNKEMVLLVSLLYYSDDILMTDIQTDPNKHLKVKKLRESNTSNISVYYISIISVLKFEQSCQPEYIDIIFKYH